MNAHATVCRVRDDRISIIIIIGLLRLKYNHNSFLILSTASSLKPTIAYELIRQYNEVFVELLEEHHSILFSSH